MSELIKKEDALEMSFSHGMNEDGKLYVPYSEVINNIKQLPSIEYETKNFPSRGCGKSIVIGAYRLGWKEGREALAKEWKGEQNESDL